MFAELSSRAAAIRDRLSAFMDEHIYPNERELLAPPPEARERITVLLEEIRTKLGADPKRTVLGGFSQGAMLSCDALLHSTQPYAGLIQLSGTLVAKQEWAPLLTKRKGLPLFQSHGTQDPILPYAMAERLRDEFLQAGVSVDWQPFRGGHEIPEPVLRKLGSFLLKAVR